MNSKSVENPTAWAACKIALMLGFIWGLGHARGQGRLFAQDFLGDPSQEEIMLAGRQTGSRCGGGEANDGLQGPHGDRQRIIGRTAAQF